MGKKIIEETFDLMTNYYISAAGEDFIREKRNIFSNDDETSCDEGAFIDWLICDEKVDYKKIKNKDNEKAVDAIISSYLSIFEVMGEGENLFVKDIFTNEDFKLGSSENINPEMIYAGRIIALEDGNYYLKVLSEYDKDLKSIFYNGIMKKYNEWFKENGSIGIKEFIGKDSIAIYRFLNIYDTISLNEEEDEEYYVYQIEYLFADREAVKEILEGKGKFIEECDEGRIYQLNINDVSFVELVLSQNKIEVETTSEEALEEAKTVMTEIFEDKIKHIRDVKLFIDDLL